MPENSNLPDQHEIAEEHLDEHTAALEQTDEEIEEDGVTAEADANLGRAAPIEGFDLYIDPKDPNLGLYVRSGSALPDFASPKQWEFYRSVAGNEMSAELVQTIEADGHVFQKLG